jgi:gliding motility-associated-like protein
MMRQRIYFFFLLGTLSTLSSKPANAQDFWVFDSINTIFSARWVHYDIQDCEVLDIKSLTSLLTPNGYTFIGTDSLITYYTGLQAEFSLAGEGIYTFPISSNFNAGITLKGTLPDTSIEGATCNYEGLAYLAGAAVSTYDYTNGALQELGSLPDTLRCGGGFTQRGGRFYMVTLENELVLLNMADLQQSQVVHMFPDSIGDIQAMGSFPYACDSISTYVFATDDTGDTQVYELDVEDYSLSFHCTLDAFVTGVASSTECTLPPCSMLYTDLDPDDSSGASGLGYQRTTCTGPVPVADADVEVFSPFVLDSIRLQVLSPPDGGAEQLSCPGAPGVEVAGNNTGSLLLSNSYASLGTDFAAAVQAVVYENTAALPTLGSREILLEMYSSYYGTMPSIATITLDTLNNLALAADTASTRCYGQEDASVSLQGENGTGGYTFTWPDGIQAAERSGLGAGSYLIQIGDWQGCSGQDTLWVQAPDSLSVGITAAALFACEGSGSLTASGVGGTGAYAFAWSNGQSGAATAGLDAGTYTVTLTDANDCEATADFELLQADTFLQTDVVEDCAGTPYMWQNQTFTTDTALCLTYTSQYGCDSTHCLELRYERREGSVQVDICPGGAYAFGGQLLTVPGTYRDTISDGQPCDSVVVLQLGLHPEPALSISQSGSLCNGGSATLTGNGSGTFIWSDGTAGPALSTTAPGTYAVTLTDANGCTASDSLSLSENSIDFTFTLGYTGCPEPGAGQLRVDSIWGGMPPYSYQLNDGPVQPGPVFSNLSAQTYPITVADGSGCARARQATLPAATPLQVSLPADTSIRLGQEVRLPAATNAISFDIAWDPPTGLSCTDCLVPLAQPPATTAYTATLTDSLGCTATARTTIYVDAAAAAYLPNAFSPNGDGRNDLLTVYAGTGVAEVLLMQAYNRWGGLVYEAQNFAPGSGGWDGVHKGESAPSGVYLCRLRLLLLDGREVEIGGEVLLVR